MERRTWLPVRCWNALQVLAADGLEEPSVSGVFSVYDPEIICSASSNPSIIGAAAHLAEEFSDT
jgi:hypothetical protein